MVKRSFFRDAPAQNIQVPNFTPEQQSGLNQNLALALQNLQNLSLPGQQLQGQIAPFDFAPIRQAAETNFAQNTLPSIAERFTSLGNNRQTSPSFINKLGTAGAGLQGELARLAAEYGLQQNALGLQQQGLNLQQKGMQDSNLFGLLRAGLQPQFQSMYQPEQKSGFKKLLESIGMLAPQLASSYFGRSNADNMQNQNIASSGLPNNSTTSLGNISSGNIGFSNPYSFGFAQNVANPVLSGLSPLGSRSSGVSPLMNQNNSLGSGYQSNRNNIINSILQGYGNL